MGARDDARLLGEAFRFLATGFSQIANDRVPGTIVSIRDGKASAPRDIRIGCNVEMVHFGSTSVALPHDFLAAAILAGEGKCRLEGEEAKGSFKQGGPPQDGAEIYGIDWIEWTYSAVGNDSFHLRGDSVVGEPHLDTFVYRKPSDLSDTIARVEVELPFERIFDFVYLTTRRHADALCANIREATGKRLKGPEFKVTK
ncbi:hypothetical protein [Sphingomicrobium aestuariivivum]|uniref:hypothetical protein n=1 Tax=Sphingomicrobium aestuariivivum TaxID=1582356 RepID=UPI001FD70B92|nr:hypothetical protein [Sphingomicrobium aestuariivivum]MCJ8190582.1 hypothetical protein [Sphingomicrobium aestuariivivum]